MRRPHRALLALLLPALTACAPGLAGTPGQNAPRAAIVVAAAASLSDVMQAVRNEFAAAHPEIRVTVTLGSSGTLQQQIEQGAPVDVFIPAGQAQMDALVQKHLVGAGDVQILAGNRVVLVAPRDATLVRTWDDLKASRVTRIAMGDPAHVPAGQYGQAVLEHLGLWAAVQSKLVLEQDVREALHHVETGDAQAGIVYATDAATSHKVRTVADAPAGSYPPVLYPIAVLAGSSHPSEARLFTEFLLSGKGQAVLRQYGFASVA